MVQKFVEREGSEKLTFLKEQLKKEYHFESKAIEKQDILFRKLENIYQNSVYRPKTLQQQFVTQETNKLENKHFQTNTLIFPKETESVMEQEQTPLTQTQLLEKWTNTLVKQEIYQNTKKLLEKQQVVLSKELLEKDYQELVERELVVQPTVEVKDFSKYLENKSVQFAKEIVLNEKHLQLNQSISNPENVQMSVWNQHTLQAYQENLYLQQNQWTHETKPLFAQLNQKIEITHGAPETVLNYQTENLTNQIENQLVDQTQYQNVQLEKKVYVHHQTPETVLNYQTENVNVRTEAPVTLQNVEQQVVLTKQIQNQIEQNQKILNEQTIQNVQNQQTVWNIEKLQEQQRHLHVHNNQQIDQSNRQTIQLNQKVEVHHPTSETVLNYQTENVNVQTESPVTLQNVEQQVLQTKQIQNQIEQNQKILNEQRIQNVQNQQSVWNIEKLQEQQRHLHVHNSQQIDQSNRQNVQLNQKVEVHHPTSETVLNYQTENVNVRTESPVTLQNVEQQVEQIKQIQNQKILNEQRVQNIQNQQTVWNIEKLQEQQRHLHVQNHQLIDQSNRQNVQLNQKVEVHHPASETVLNYQTENVNIQTETPVTLQNVEQQVVQTKQIQNQIEQNQKVLNEQRVKNVQNQQTVWNIEKLQEQQKHLHVYQKQVSDQTNHTHLHLEQKVDVYHPAAETVLNYTTEIPVSQMNHPAVNVENQLVQIVQQHLNNQTSSQITQNIVNQHLENMQNIVHRSSMVFNHQTLQKRMEQHQHNNVLQHISQEYSMAPISIIYGEEGKAEKQNSSEIMRLQQQVDEVVRDLKTVEEKTVIHKKEITAKQQEIVKEYIHSNSNVWLEGAASEAIRKEVQKSMSEGMPENINRITTKVYRKLEKELKMERGRRGMN